ncbi:hypothetical protein ICF92_003278 [Escherichia coli]|nr:hypothetical protein [Escherichia coli]
MDKIKVFEYVLHTAVGKFTGYAPVRLAEPFGEKTTAYHLLEMPGDARPGIFVRGDSIIAVECRELEFVMTKSLGRDGERVNRV